MTWKEKLLKEAEEIVTHGQGKISFNVGPLGQDKINILIEAGKIHRFIVEKFDNLED